MKNKHLEVMIEFLIFGVVMGIVEDVIVIMAVTDHKITLTTIFLAFLITIPFAIFGEIIVDKHKVINPKNKKLKIFLEFFIMGVIVGLLQDIITIVIITGAKITPKMILIILLIAIPFGIFGEIIVDKHNLIKVNNSDNNSSN